MTIPSVIPATIKTPQPVRPAQKLALADISAPFTAKDRVRFGNGGEKPGVFKTLSTLFSHLSKPGNKEYLTGYAIKYIPDVALPALFSVPVVGWVLGVPGIFVANWANKKGDRLVKEATQKSSNKNNPFTNLIEMAQTWSGDWKQIKKANKDQEILDVLADQYDAFVNNLLPDEHDAKTRNTLMIGTADKKNSKIYTTLSDLINAKRALGKSFFRHLSAPFDWIHGGLTRANAPRAFARVFQLPKLILFGIFFLLKRKP